MKNLKLAILAIPMMILCLGVQAQSDKLKVNEKKGETFKLKGSANSVQTTASGGLILLQEYNNTKAGIAHLKLFDENLNLDKVKELPISIKDKRVIYHSLQKIGNKFLLFFTFRNELKKKVYLFYAQVDPSDLSMSDDIYQLGAYNLLGQKRGFMSGYFNVKNSDNGKFLVITAVSETLMKGAKYNWYGALKKSGKAGNRKYSFWVMNDKLTLINHRESYEISAEPGNELVTKSFRCDESGSVYILTRSEKERKTSNSERQKTRNKATTVISNRFFLINVFHTNGKDFAYETDKEIILSDLNFGINEKDRILDLMGIQIENVSNQTVATALLHVSLDMDDLTLIETREIPFTEEFIEDINNKILEKAKKAVAKAKFKKNKAVKNELVNALKSGIFNLSILAAVAYDQEGTPTAIMERHWMEVVAVTSTNSKGVTTTTYYDVYHYGDIVIMKLPEEEVKPQATFIPKDDYGLVWKERGFEFFEKDKAWYFFSEYEIRRIEKDDLSSKVHTFTKGKTYGALSNTSIAASFVVNKTTYIGITPVKGRKVKFFKLQAS